MKEWQDNIGPPFHYYADLERFFQDLQLVEASMAWMAEVTLSHEKSNTHYRAFERMFMTPVLNFYMDFPIEG